MVHSPVLADLDSLLSGLPEVTPAELDAHGTHASMATKNLRPLVAALNKVLPIVRWMDGWVDGKAWVYAPDGTLHEFTEAEMLEAVEALGALQRDIAKLKEDKR